MSKSDEDEMKCAEDRQEAPHVEVFHRVNRLKLKAGAPSPDAAPGFLDPKAIERADLAIKDEGAVYVEELKDVLGKLEGAWEAALAVSNGRAYTEIEEVYHYANHVKDLAATFGYGLMKHFGASLRAFAADIDIKNEAHHVIVRAHLDVMWVVYHENIKDHGGPKAEELKEIVAQAIERYK